MSGDCNRQTIYMKNWTIRKSTPAPGSVEKHQPARKRHWLAIAATLAVILIGSARVMATVTGVSIASPTTAVPLSLEAGQGLPVTIAYTADNPPSGTVSLTLQLLSGATVVGSTNLTIAESIPGATTNLIFFITNCTLNGTLTLQVDATAGATVSDSQASSVELSGGKPYPFAVTGGGAYCPGSSGSLIGLAGSEEGVMYQLKKGSSNSGLPVAGTGSAISFGYKVFVGTYTVVAINSGSGCSNIMAGSTVVSVGSGSVGGTATPDAGTICSGSTASIALSGQVGSIVEWQYTVDDGETWQSIASTSNPLITAPLTATTYFQAVVKNGDCVEALSSIAGVVVEAATVGGMATATSPTICSGSSTTIGLSGHTGSVVNWQISPDGVNWTNIPAKVNPLNTGNLTASRHFRALVRSGACSIVESTEAVVTVNPATVPGTTTPGNSTVCSGAGTLITLSGFTGTIVKWQSSVDGINWSDINVQSNPLPTGHLTVSTLFRAIVQSGDCGELDSSASTVTVEPSSVGGTATPASGTLCSGSATTIALSGYTGNIMKWQWSTDGNSWNDILTTANPLYTGGLNGTRLFRAVVQSGNCTPDNSSTASVTVNLPAGVASQPASAVKLVGEAVTFSITASNASGFQWRKDGSPIGGANGSDYTINSVSAAAAGSYDCVITGDSPCGAAVSHAATLTVATKLAFKSEPVSTTAGATLPAIVVQVQDENGNEVSVAGQLVSLTLNGAAVLGGTTSLTTDAGGAATFSDLSIVTAGSSYTLTANSGGLTAPTSTSFAISAAAASAYRVSAATGNPSPGAADALTIRLVDQYSNTVSSFSGDKNLTFSGLATAANGTHPTVTSKAGNAVSLGTTTTITFTNGQSSAGATLTAYKAESATLNVTDGTLSSGSGAGTGAALSIANAAPTAGAVTVYRARNAQLRLLTSSLLAAASDANGDIISFVGAETSSAQGATVSANSTYVLYSIPSGTNPGMDTFNYTVSDGTTTSTGTITVSLNAEPAGTNFNLVSYGLDNGGHPAITFAGIPGLTYKVQRTQGLEGTPVWTDVWTTNAPQGGLFQFVDPEIVNPAFYRAINQ